MDIIWTDNKVLAKLKLKAYLWLCTNPHSVLSVFVGFDRENVLLFEIRIFGN